MSPKERVRANIYMELLKQEKAKNKRMSMFSVCFLFVGIVASSAYTNISNKVNEANTYLALDKTNVTNSIQTAADNGSDNSMTNYMFDQFMSDSNNIKINADEFFSIANRI